MSNHVRLLIMKEEFSFRESIFNTRLTGPKYEPARNEFTLKVNRAIKRFSEQNGGRVTREMARLQEEIQGLSHHVETPLHDGLYKMQQNGEWSALDTTGFVVNR